MMGVGAKVLDKLLLPNEEAREESLFFIMAGEDKAPHIFPAMIVWHWLIGAVEVLEHEATFPGLPYDELGE